MVDLKVGYNMGRLMPYVTFGVGRETAIDERPRF